MNTPPTIEELPKSYAPAEAEPRAIERWDTSHAFHVDPGAEADPYCILIPPPNVTAALHLGHAFNNSLQDVLVRYHRLRGLKTVWLPGTDHAGIATQTVVDRRLQQSGEPSIKDYKRTEAEGGDGRNQFIAKVQSWKDEYEATITNQLKSMGCSCDWPRQRFTMDPICARAVREAFYRLFRDGLIYRGKRLVNWDPVTQTALADDEVEMVDVDGHFWYLRYPLVHPPRNPDDPNDTEPVTWSELAARGYPIPEGNEYGDEVPAWVTVATTRPETYLGDTAVAVNPQDPRAGALHGLMVQLPIVGRVIPILQDDYVVLPDAESSDPKAKYATGFLKVTPAHDPNDWEIGQRHDLPIVNVMAPDAAISADHGWEDVGDARLFVGLSRDDAREKVVAEFKARGLLEQIRPYQHTVGHSYRSHAPIEPYLSDQWYVKVSDDRLVGEAQRALHESQFDGERPMRIMRPGSIWVLHGSREARPDDAVQMQIETWQRDGRISTLTQLTAGSDAFDWVVIVNHMNDDEVTAYLTDCGFSRSDDLVNELVAVQQDGAANPDGDGALQFFPARYAKMYQSWHENLRDWCISRQLWWGHRIPVWRRPQAVAELPDDAAEWTEKLLQWQREGRVAIQYRGEFTPLLRAEKDDYDLTALFVCVHDPDHDHEVIEALESHGLVQDPDVLDTWFSSALWPLSTMGWPDGDADTATQGLLDTFNPSSVLCTAREIITLWVSRMVMFNRYFTHNDRVPFRHVYIHAMIQDGYGQKMSKSLGNGVDPRDIIRSHGADAMRYVLTQMATATQDVRMPVDMICPHCDTTFHPKETTSPNGYRVAEPTQPCPKCGGVCVTAYGVVSGHAFPSDEQPAARNTSSKFDLGRNFCNKLWNATRFALRNLEGTEATANPALALENLSTVDRWIINQLHRTLHVVEDAVHDYQFNVYADAMYDFIWRDVCDWYLEAIKPTVRDDAGQQQVLRTVLSAALRMLHPICPFITETLWDSVQAVGAAGVDGINLPPSDVAATAPWPDIACRVHHDDAGTMFERTQSLVNEIRALRSKQNVPPKKKIHLHVPTGIAQLVAGTGPVVPTLAGLESIGDIPVERPAGAMSLTFEGTEVLVSGIVDAVDTDAEVARLEKIIAEKTDAITGFSKRLSNPGYVNNAPAHIVDETRAKLAEAQADLDAAQKSLDELT